MNTQTKMMPLDFMLARQADQPARPASRPAGQAGQSASQTGWPAGQAGQPANRPASQARTTKATKNKIHERGPGKSS